MVDVINKIKKVRGLGIYQIFQKEDFSEKDYDKLMAAVIMYKANVNVYHSIERKRIKMLRYFAQKNLELNEAAKQNEMIINGHLQGCELIMNYTENIIKKIIDKNHV